MQSDMCINTHTLQYRDTVQSKEIKKWDSSEHSVQRKSSACHFGHAHHMFGSRSLDCFANVLLYRTENVKPSQQLLAIN